MRTTIMCTGDVNLMNVTDGRAPFVRVVEVLRGDRIDRERGRFRRFYDEDA